MKRELNPQLTLLQQNPTITSSFSFVVSWRRFVRNPLSQDTITDLGNGELLCEHGGLVYPLDLDTESDYESV
jgi:hypothetical protein